MSRFTIRTLRRLSPEIRDSHGSCKKGQIQADFQDLINILGQPTFLNLWKDEDLKTRCEWIGFLEIEGEETSHYQSLFTIYDWKREGAMPWQGRDWNVGGFNNHAGYLAHLLHYMSLNRVWIVEDKETPDGFIFRGEIDEHKNIMP